MPEPHRRDSWLAQHKSAIFMFFLFCTGSVLLIAGLLSELPWFEPLPRFWRDFFSKLLIELSIATFAGVIATIFLSFGEVRHQLASVIATLFSEGKISALLSPGARDVLHKELTLQRIVAAEIEGSLFKQLRGHTDEYLQAVHVRNLTQHTAITSYPMDERFLRKSITRRFTLDASHLGRPTTFEYKCSYRFSLPLGVSMETADILEVFEGKIGSKSFDRKSLQCTPPPPGESVFRFEFRLETQIEGIVDGFFQCVMLTDREDRSSGTTIRYPTKGFSAELTYDKEHEYDCNWFQSSPPVRPIFATDPKRCAGGGFAQITPSVRHRSRS